MYMTCRHIKTNGLPCESPALKGGQFCYHHSRSHTVKDDVRCGPLVLPLPEDAAAIQLSIARINEAILTGSIDLKKAALLLAGLKLAARFIDPKKYFDAESTVQNVEYDTRGDELAPPNYVCDDEEDCNDCPVSDHCPNCIHEDEDDVDVEKKNAVLKNLHARADTVQEKSKPGAVILRLRGHECSQKFMKTNCRCHHPSPIGAIESSPG